MAERLDPGEVQTLEDFAAFVRRLSKNDIDAWDNPTTVRFLESMAAWIEDSFLTEGTPMHGIPRPEPSWSAFALMLIAGTDYE